MEPIFRWVLSALIIIVAGLEIIQLVTRYVFKIPVLGLEEVLIYFALWLYVPDRADHRCLLLPLGPGHKPGFRL